jgi:hypothetical protein
MDASPSTSLNMDTTVRWLIKVACTRRSARAMHMKRQGGPDDHRRVKGAFTSRASLCSVLYSLRPCLRARTQKLTHSPTKRPLTSTSSVADPAYVPVADALAHRSTCTRTGRLAGTLRACGGRRQWTALRAGPRRRIGVGCGGEGGVSVYSASFVVLYRHYPV